MNSSSSTTKSQKHLIRKNHRRLRSLNPNPTKMDPSIQSSDNQTPTPIPSPNFLNLSNPKPLNSIYCPSNSSTSIPSPNPNPNPGFEDNGSNGWGYCTEEQLEGILMKNLEFCYNDALSKLVSLGYSDDVALNAILRNGNWFGELDVCSNIVNNALDYLRSSFSGGNGDVNGNDSEKLVFSSLRQLEEYSIASMVCLLRELRPHLSRGDAMWCLLMSDLNVGRAQSIEIPVIPSPDDGIMVPVGDSNVENVGGNGVNNGVGGVPPSGLCSFHGGWGFGSGGNGEFPSSGLFKDDSGEMILGRDIECPKRFDLSPSMKSLLKRNVAAFAAGFRAKQVETQCSNVPSSDSSGKGKVPAETAGENRVEQFEESGNLEKGDAFISMLSKFLDLNLEENLKHVAEDRKDKVIVSLLRQIKETEKQVKERKEWAQQKAMQAARKLSSDLTELKLLRMEMEDTQRLKKGKQTLEETTMKRLKEMEDALRKASSKVDRANADVRRLETENAEIRAEMEACKLSASESVTSCLEVAKREKKSLKKLLAWEKQKTKLQEEISEEKRKISGLQQQLVQIEQASKEAEVKWRQTLKEKEAALVQVEEERRLKEAAEASNKRKLETLRLKIDIDFQRHKDDLRRLEQELSRLKVTAQSVDLQNPSNALPAMNDGVNGKGENINSLLQELDKLDDTTDFDGDRQCMLCKEDEVSVVFLPCAHQVICANCNDSYGKKGKASCPCCRIAIEQRIRVFGASS